MNVKIIAHTRVSDEFQTELLREAGVVCSDIDGYNERAAVALTAIRCCYSPNKPSEIVALEGAKYFGKDASDGEGGTDADRLFRHIVRSGHASTLEHITYTFAIEGVSRALLAQLTRHRQFSFSVQSQRYVKFGSGDKSGGFDYVTPSSLDGKETGSRRLRGFDEETNASVFTPVTATETYVDAMESLQGVYDALRAAGVPAEDARMVLPNAAACNLVMTGNLRAILEFYRKRNRNTHAQWEIADLAESLREEVTKVDAWTAAFFDHK
ncbi:FAD-dependent thymidylate synthase [Paenibacillus naphthalenovorans]|uniref:FAD-dependent thymidylate synthase n=1 Tax=Paenibacillus naphthalenovorans TaxID=162209 RepID=UPI003D2955AA